MELEVRRTDSPRTLVGIRDSQPYKCAKETYRQVCIEFVNLVSITPEEKKAILCWLVESATGVWVEDPAIVERADQILRLSLPEKKREALLLFFNTHVRVSILSEELVKIADSL